MFILQQEMNQNPILVELYRANILESFHRGAVCMVDERGDILYEIGDIKRPIFSRSAMKYFQHLPLIESGAAKHFNFSDEEIAIMCGSHNGEPEHLRVVNSILQKIGLEADALQCGAHYPSYDQAAISLYQQGTEASALHNNCSGKHAGFLALCQFMQWPIEGHLKPEHPLQQAIKSACANMYDYDERLMPPAIDGCSAPNYAVPLYHQALGFMRLVSGNGLSVTRKEACQDVVNAVLLHPFMVAGSKRYCTDMMQAYPGRIIGKVGAEGVFCMAFVQEKVAVAIKIDDGKMLPQYNLAQAIIEASGLFSADAHKKVHHYLESDLLNWNQIKVGSIKVNKDLHFPAFK
jgi:L-asparaginase II